MLLKKYLSEIVTTLPIVDTVERVQGITVDIVIYSVCTTDLKYLNSKRLLYSHQTVLMLP
jgi:hypothetical protein